MISKELLSEVLGQVYIDATRSIKDENKHFAIGSRNCILLGDKGFNHWNDSINIYELAFRTRDYFKIRSKHLSLNQNIDDIFKEANSIYESLSQ